MKTRLSIFALSILAAFVVLGATRTYVVFDVINQPADGNTMTVNGATRTWKTTVSTPSTQIALGIDIATSRVNLFNQIAANGFAGPMVLEHTATGVKLTGQVGQSVTFSAVGAWCTPTSGNLTVSTLTSVRVPLSSLSNAERTNVATELASGLGSYSILPIDPTTTIASELVGKTNTQTISGAKVWTGSNVFHSVGLSNGVNHGAAFRSPGAGLRSEQFGEGASAASTESIALGANTIASGAGAIAIGSSATAYNSSISIGGEISGANAVGIGSGTSATGSSGIALGYSAAADYADSIAIGASVATTATNEIRIGGASHATIVPGTVTAAAVTNSTYYGTVGFLTGGQISSSSLTNATSRGTHTVNASLAFTRLEKTTLTTGNNSAVDFGGAVYVDLKSGPGAAFTICGIAGGAAGRFLIVDNRTAYNMTIANESGTDPTPANRIQTTTGADIATTGTGVAMLVYNGDASRWRLVSLEP